jgi:hypothetical protein
LPIIINITVIPSIFYSVAAMTLNYYDFY